MPDCVCVYVCMHRACVYVLDSSGVQQTDLEVGQDKWQIEGVVS